MAFASASAPDLSARSQIGAASIDSRPPKSSPILIGGAPRSGTTLLRAIINAHPNIVCGPELRAIPALCVLLANVSAASADVLKSQYGVSRAALDAAFADSIVEFTEPLRLAAGKPRVAEKTPANVLHFPVLRRLFPESPLLCIHRDPRDVVASLMGMDWRDAKSGNRLPITTDPAAAARLWIASIDIEMRMAGDRAFMAIRYEDLVRRPNAAIRGVFDFLDEPPSNASFFHQVAFDPQDGENESSNARVALPIDDSSVGRWRRDLTPNAVRIVESLAGPRMASLGYA